VIYRVSGWIGWVALGALLEIAIFFSALPKHSEDPVTAWQQIAGYVLAPGGWVTRVLISVFEHTIGLPLPVVCTLLTMIVAFTVNAAVLGLPFWALVQAVARILSNPRNPAKA